MTPYLKVLLAVLFHSCSAEVCQGQQYPTKTPKCHPIDMYNATGPDVVAYACWPVCSHTRNCKFSCSCADLNNLPPICLTIEWRHVQSVAMMLAAHSLVGLMQQYVRCLTGPYNMTVKITDCSFTLLSYYLINRCLLLRRFGRAVLLQPSRNNSSRCLQQ